MLVLGSLAYWENNNLQVTHITVENDRVPAGLDGLRILQISDLHNKSFGKNQEKLLEKVKAEKPDLIVITGDLVDSYRTDLEPAMAFVEGAVAMAPVYYVTGNHEARIPEYKTLKKRMKAKGVHIIDDDRVLITKKHVQLELIGVQDPHFYEKKGETHGKKINADLKQHNFSKEMAYTILLSHRPELFNIYVKNEIDLVFTGHAHGGQIRLPFIGPLIAPNQGLFPKYTKGAYTKENTTMIVSPGLGNSSFPIRVLDPPTIMVVELKSVQ